MHVIGMMMFRQAKSRVKNEDTFLRLGDATVRIDRSGPHPIIAVTGRVTIDSKPPLRSVLIEEVLRENAAPVLIVDLSRVSHLDTSGFATLLEMLSCAHEHSKRLRVVGISGQPRKLAELANLDQIFTALGSEVVWS